MPIFRHPESLALVVHFTVPRVQTWGSEKDRWFKEEVLRKSGLSPEHAMGQFDWFVFCISCTVSRTRANIPRAIPDVENIPKLIVDAFTGILYPDDDLRYVRGVQAEAEWGEEDRTEVWIYGHPKIGG